MGQIGSTNFRARQMFVILEIQIVSAKVKHMNELMHQNTFHFVGGGGRIMANDNLIHLWIVAAGYICIANFTGEMTP